MALTRAQSVSLQFPFLRVNMLGILLLIGTISGFTLLEIGTGFLQGTGLPLLHIGIKTNFQKPRGQSSSRAVFPLFKLKLYF